MCIYIYRKRERDCVMWYLKKRSDDSEDQKGRDMEMEMVEGKEAEMLINLISSSSGGK